jgi:dolichol-phosphate mannosyltransferase
VAEGNFIPAAIEYNAMLSSFINVVIPVYRAERILPALCERLVTVLSNLGYEYEILLVDDRSPDRSWEVLRELMQVYDRITAVRLSRNFGQHYAITAGLDLADAEWTVIMDCDLQDQPEEIPRLLEVASRGYGVVLAKRMGRDDGFRKSLFSRLFYWSFNLLSGYRMDPSVGSFRIMSRSVVEAYRKMPETGRLFGGMVHWLGFETAFVEVAHAARPEGRSSYNIRSLTRLALDGIFAFSSRPLYLSIGTGVVVSLAAAVLTVKLVISHLLNPRYTLPGWASEVVITAFIGGLMLMNLGIIGIYIGRIYDEVKRRPLYVIDRIASARSETALAHHRPAVAAKVS